MANFKKCFAILDEDIANLPEVQRKRVQESLRALQKRLGTDSIKAANEIDRLLRKERFNQLKTERSRLNQNEAIKNTFEEITENPGQDVIDYLKSMFAGGGAGEVRGARQGMKTLEDDFIFAERNVVEKVIEDTGLSSDVVNGKLDTQLAEAADKILKGESVDLTTDVGRIADAFVKSFRRQRDWVNLNGGVRGQLDNFFGTRRYDSEKIGKAGFDDFRNAVYDSNPNFEKSFEGVGPDQFDVFLKDMYDEITAGQFEGVDSVVNDVDQGIGIVDPFYVNTNKSRKLIFDSVVDEARFNAKFGKGSVYERWLSGLKSSARSASTAKFLGVAPRDGFKDLLKRTTDFYKQKAAEGDVKALKNLTNIGKNFGTIFNPEKPGSFNLSESRVNQFYDKFTTFGEQPGRSAFYDFSKKTSRFFRTIDLGSSVLANFVEVLTAPSVLRNTSLDITMPQAVRAYARNLLSNIDPKYRKESALFISKNMQELIVNMEIHGGDFRNIQKGNKIAQTLLKPFGLEQVSRKVRETVVRTNMEMLHGRRNKSYDQLSSIDKSTLQAYRIDSLEWDMLRATELIEPDSFNRGKNKSLLDPTAIEFLDEQLISNIIKKNKVSLTVSEAKLQARQKFFNYLNDISSLAVNAGDARTRAALTTDPRLAAVLEMAFMYKNWYRSFGRVIMTGALRGSGASSIGEAISDRAFKKEGLYALTSLFASSTIASMLVNDLKDFFHTGSIAAYDPNDVNALRDRYARALIDSGFVGGYYSSILFSQREGNVENERLTALAGPVIGRASEFGDIVDKMIFNKKFPSKEIIGFTRRLIPGQNQVYIKPVLDYYHYNVINEWLNPGTNAKFEQRQRKQNRIKILGD